MSSTNPAFDQKDLKSSPASDLTDIKLPDIAMSHTRRGFLEVEAKTFTQTLCSL